MCRGVAIRVATQFLTIQLVTHINNALLHGVLHLKSTNIPYLYSRNGIFYYRNRNVWKSLRTGCKTEAFKKLCQFVSTRKTDTPAKSLKDKSNLSEKKHLVIKRTPY